jgi:hypothetical protein
MGQPARRTGLRGAEAGFQQATEHRLQKYLPLLPANPRTIKRFLNDYTMFRAARTAEGSTVGLDALALWAILSTRWPLLAAHLSEAPDDIGLAGESLEALAGLPSEIQALLASSKVAALVRFPHGGPLRADSVRACCGAGDTPQQ